jgi:transcriptional regulator with XRE-family HTH domain
VKWERLAELRKEKGLTQEELGNTFNVTRHTVTMWETGNTEPDYATLIKLADFLEVSTDYLLGHQAKISLTKEQKETLKKAEEIINEITK